MATPPPDPDLYEQLVVLSQDAFDAGLYDVAYHTLSAALHWANSAHDLARLEEVATVARVQRAQLAVHAPAHPIGVEAAT